LKGREKEKASAMTESAARRKVSGPGLREMTNFCWWRVKKRKMTSRQRSPRLKKADGVLETSQDREEGLCSEVERVEFRLPLKSALSVQTHLH